MSTPFIPFFPNIELVCLGIVVCHLHSSVNWSLFQYSKPCGSWWILEFWQYPTNLSNITWISGTCSKIHYMMLLCCSVYPWFQDLSTITRHIQPVSGKSTQFLEHTSDASKPDVFNHYLVIIVVWHSVLLSRPVLLNNLTRRSRDAGD